MITAVLKESFRRKIFFKNEIEKIKFQLERKNSYFTHYIIKIFPWVHEPIKLVLIYTCTSLDKILILNSFYVE